MKPVSRVCCSTWGGCGKGVGAKRTPFDHILRYAERMEVFGPDLGMLHTRAMSGGLFELRLKAAEGIARVFYCTVVDRRIVMLHQFIKKSDKIPRKELDIAHRRMKEVKHDYQS